MKLIIAWYDMWIGAFWDREHRYLYVFPFPCVGVRLHRHHWDRWTDGTRAETCCRCGKARSLPSTPGGGA